MSGVADAAREEAAKAVEFESRDPSVLLLCARVAQLGGRPSDALTLLEKAVAERLSPREIDTEPDLAGLVHEERYATLMKHR